MAFRPTCFLRWLAAHRPDVFLEEFRRQYPPDRVVAYMPDGSTRTFRQMAATVRSMTFSVALYDFRQAKLRTVASWKMPKFFKSVWLVWRYGYSLVDA